MHTQEVKHTKYKCTHFKMYRNVHFDEQPKNVCTLYIL